MLDRTGYGKNVRQTFYILTRDYQLVDQIEVKGAYLAYVTSDRLFFHRNEDAYMPIVYSLDKSKIGSHDLTLESVETHVPLHQP